MADSHCTKVCHQSQESANEHLANLLKSGEHPSRALRLRVYWCRQCYAFHVGHRLSEAQKRKLFKPRQRRERYPRESAEVGASE